MKSSLTLIGLLGLVALNLQGAAPAAATWADAMVAQRASYQENAAARETPWFTTGPLKANGFKDALFPEHGVDLAAKDKKGQPLWEQAKKLRDGQVNSLTAGGKTSTYFYRTLTAKKPGKLKLSFGSDDGLEVWLNGKSIVSRDVPRGVAPDQDVVTVDLVAGENKLLMKIYNRTGGCGMYYASGGQLTGLTTKLEAKYPEEMRLFKAYLGDRWFRGDKASKAEQAAIADLLKRLKDSGDYQKRLAALGDKANGADGLNLFLEVAREVDRFERAAAQLNTVNVAALKLAIADLTKSFPQQYKNGPKYAQLLGAFEKDQPSLKTALQAGDRAALARLEEVLAVSRKALLENPLLNFDQVLVVKRREEGALGLPSNWQGNSSLPSQSDNEIATFDYKRDKAALKTLYRPAQKVFVGDVDLNFDADKMLFSSIGTQGRWQIFELNADGTGLRQVTKGIDADIDNYDPMYLPDGRIIFDSTTSFAGVPCVSGHDYVGNLHIMKPDGTGVRRLCYDQDNNWCPVMLPHGRVLYLRWEYTDSAHYFSRVLMSMNPDGTGQTEFYHSNSYWPNSMFYARPIPGSATKFVAIISGHHGVRRAGEMVLFDASKGRQEASGAVQRIPGYGKPVEPVIKDGLVNNSWPKFLHPYPLSENYFLVSAKLTAQSPWGLYLVDTFDNMLLLKEEPGYALFEPLPLRKTERPPVIVDKVVPGETNATVYIHNIYLGDGLRGVPPGSVKNLRVYQYEYSYRNTGGHYVIGMEGPWDVRRIIGTVPVAADGSAMFTIPANTPVAVQPLDNEGKALQLMRSWFVGMPGEMVSCVGCHEKQNQSSSLHQASAARKLPVAPTPWHGPKRGFSFVREVQPVLNQYCVGCHDGKEADRPNFADTTIAPTSKGLRDLPKSYVALHPWVRRNGPEGDYHTLTPLEFHANTSLLVQMLRKGHHNVALNDEAWDRLITWIDLNVPCYGTFKEAYNGTLPKDYEQRRYECKKIYSNVDEQVETYPPMPEKKVAFVQPAPLPPRPAPVQVPNWPLNPDQAKQMQLQAGSPVEISFDLGGGVLLKAARIPAGEFAMGDVHGDQNEYPMARVKIDKPFYLGTTEVSLEQFQKFDPSHRNGYYDMHYKDQVKPGYLMDDPKGPVIRVSWNQAMGFCRWLSARTGKKVTLPTEAQWEWACRAGTDSPEYYGDQNSDFAAYANLADASLSQLAVRGVDPQPIKNPDKYWDFVPKESRFNDGTVHLAQVGHYKANAWGLHDMIGNVAEWTLNNYRPYPYALAANASDAEADGYKAVRGGSWADRPREARSSSRLDYPAWQRVYNVGFRVAILD